MPRLLVKKREEIITEYVFRRTKTRIFVGSKHGNDIVLADKNVSEQHCLISFNEGQYTVKDQNTINGTQLNGKMLTENVFNFGDTITIGQFNIMLLDDVAVGKHNASAPQYYLIGIYGKFYGKKYFLKQDGDTFIGREKLSPRGIDNDIILTGDMTVSKGHAKISSSEGKYTITDVGSTGGVAVNSIKLGQLNSTSLYLGDEISIGRTIFRVVDYFNENYSLPIRQKIFLLKLFRLLKVFLFCAIMIFSIGAMYVGFTNLSVLNGTTSKKTFSIDSKWSQNLPLKPTESEEYSITATPAIADLNGDGVNDIAMLSSSGFLYAWNGDTGERLWKPIEIYNSGIASLVVDDVNNDGTADIVAVSDSSLIYVIDGQTGNIIRREILGGVISETTPVVCDLDENGKKDIVVVSEDGAVHFLYDIGFDSSYSRYTEFVDGPIYSSPIILSKKNFLPFVVIANYDSKVFFIDGKTRTKKTVNLVELTGKAHLIAGSPAVGDVNGDGVDEVIVQSNVPQYVSAIDTTSFSVLWTYFVEPTPPANIKFNSSPVVADFNNDGKKDVLIVSANASIQILKGNTTFPTGELLCKLEMPESKRIISTPSVFDFDKDSIPDILFGTEDGKIVLAKSNAKRKEIEIITDIKGSNSAITSTPLIADVNGDEKIEIVYVDVQDSIQMIKTNIKTLKNLLIYPMFLGNSQHCYNFALDTFVTKYVKMILFGLLLLVAYGFILVRSIIVKSKKRVKVIYL